jgi:hypothetical protein
MSRREKFGPEPSDGRDETRFIVHTRFGQSQVEDEDRHRHCEYPVRQCVDAGLWVHPAILQQQSIAYRSGTLAG